ncbi:MAG: hypothetical protein KDN19_12990 [Verrucomicrobiae bacterium]|nr:hypothetical protein [Verrucomicrobiae bacterium]
MNTASANSEPEPADLTRDLFEPMEGEPTLSHTFDTLLKKPGSVLYSLHHRETGSARLLRNLALTTIGCLAVFGLVLGFYSGGHQLWAAPLKVVIGVLGSALITLPSLYIFSCLNGLDITARSVAGVMAAAVCLLSLLLLGLAPVAWIFAQSTEQIAFFGFLVLVFWIVGLWFGLGLIFRAAGFLGVKRRFHLAIWAAIFTLVTLQMSTTLRPIIGESDHFLTGEKRFFLAHWLDHLDGDGAVENNGWKP